jgi:hypothetical protein
MEDSIKQKQDAKAVFRKCGTCSQTFAHLLNRDFGHPLENEERALDPLAGGIANQGHQCGMLWGASLAIGGESYRQNENLEQAIAVSVTATQHIVDSFLNRTKTVNCKEIIGYDLSSVFGLVKFMIKTLAKGMNNSQCFNLAEDWAPEAMQAGSEALKNDKIELNHKPRSCASEVVRQMGGTEEEVSMVAGFAGGLGLSGEACGALSSAIWFRTLKWCENYPGKTPPMFSNPIAKKYLKLFKEETNSCMLCKEITGLNFESINEHSEYVNKGGCKKLIQSLANAEI